MHVALPPHAGELVSIALIAVLLVTAVPSRSVFAAPPVLIEAARELIEGVLGAGTVKAISFSGAGAELLVRWESATFRPALGVNDAREMLYGEAVLATGAIFGTLRAVRRVRFTVVSRDRMLVTGERVRGQDLRMVFALGLGGPYAPGAPGSPPKPAPSGGAAQEL